MGPHGAMPTYGVADIRRLSRDSLDSDQYRLRDAAATGSDFRDAPAGGQGKEEHAMTDEVWTMRDGTTIAVGDMDEGHVRNALRMVLRKARRATEKRDRLAAMTRRVMEEAYADVDPQDILHAQAMRDLSNPNCF